jgi:leucyl/phenylalanyl-tRNA--protein transferase
MPGPVAGSLVVEELTPQLVIAAYAEGYFPMDVDGEIGWFSPDPRTILPLEGFHASKHLRQAYDRRGFDIRFDTAFLEVMRACGDRPEGTWISPEMISAFTELHRLGPAHSVEAWKDGKLAGGLYGVVVGGAFFGESMFYRVRDASKVALVALVERMRGRGFSLLDVQWMTEHLRRFGAVEIPRKEYLSRLGVAIRRRCHLVDQP